MIAKDDIDSIVRVGKLSQECIGETQFADIMTCELMSLFQSGSAVFMEFDPNSDGNRLSSCTSYGIDNNHGIAYIEHYHHSDPCYQKLLQITAVQPQSSVSTDQVINTERSYVNSAYYQDFLRNTGVHRSLVFTLANGKQPVGLIGLHRSKASSAYSESDHMKVQLITPYLSTAVMFRQKERELQQQNLLKHSILKSSNVSGYLLFDYNLICIDNGKTGPCSSSVEVIIDQAVGLHCEELVPKELFEIVSNTLNDKADHECRLLEQFDNLVNASHIRVELIRGADGEGHVLLLFLNNDIELVCEQRMEYFGLTERQKEIVKLVQLGFTNPQMSMALNISAKTVENHLTQVYAKTYTHNKTSLLRQLHV